MRKLAAALFSFAAAIAAAQYLLTPMWQYIAAVIFALIGVFGIALRSRRRLAVMLIAFGAAAGFLWNAAYTAITFAPVEKMDGTEQTVTATLKDYPEITDYGARCEVRVKTEEGRNISAVAYFYDDSAESLTPGAAFEMTASFERADIENGEEVSYFTSKGQFLRANSAEIQRVISEGKADFSNFPAYLSRAIKDKITEIFPENTEGFVRALLTGDKSRMNADDALGMKQTGVYHIVAISGFHVSVLTGFLYLILGRRKKTALAILPVLVVFAAVSGFTPSIVRAVIMQFFLMAAPIFDRDDDPATSLSAALFTILAVNPFAVKSVSLQLSFCAMLGIILVSGNIYQSLLARFNRKRRRKREKRVFYALAGAFSSSVGALILTTPLSAVYFGYVTVIAPLTNIIISWAVTLAFCGGMLAVALGFAWLPLGIAAAKASSVPVLYVVSVAKSLSRFAFATVFLNDIPTLVWFALTYGFIVLFIIIKPPVRKAVVPACISITVLCGIILLNADAPQTFASSAKLTATVLDVGQGQSIVLTSGDYTAVVDCGSSDKSNAGEITYNYLTSVGRTDIDLLVLTHFHSDHANGADELLQYANVSLIAAPTPEYDDNKSENDLLSAAEACGAETVFITEDTEITLGDMSLTLYAPLGSKSENERCVCVLASEDDFDFLITGDINESLEKIFTEHAYLPDIEAMVVGHHGSKHSTTQELLSAVTPETAIISVGENNYGHPSQTVIDRLNANGITVYRTDEVGNITISQE